MSEAVAAESAGDLNKDRGGSRGPTTSPRCRDTDLKIIFISTLQPLAMKVWRQGAQLNTPNPGRTRVDA